MSNPTSVPASGTIYTVKSLQPARQGLPATSAPQSPYDNAATSFQAALGKAASDNLRDVNDSGVSAATPTIGTTGQNEMPKNRQAPPEAGSTAEALMPVNSGVIKDGSATAMSSRPILRPTLMQTQLAKSTIGPSGPSRSSEKVELSREPAQSVMQPPLTPSQPAQVDLHAATASRSSPADQMTGDATPSATSSSPAGAKKPEGHTGQVRGRARQGDDTRSTASDQAAPKPDPTITIFPGVYAPITTPVYIFSADASAQSPGSYQAETVGRQADANQPLEDRFASAAADAVNTAPTPAAENFAAISSSPFGVATAISPAREASPAAKSVAVGVSASGNATRAGSRHTSSDASAYLMSSMASAPTDQDNLTTVLPAADPIQAAALPAFTSGSMLTGKPVDATVADGSQQVAAPQVGPALISLATRTDGSNEITVSLNPKDLGEVQVHLIRGHDGTTTVSITASNPETLQELAQNVHHLHAALDMANVPADGRTMNFNTASAAAPGQGQSDFADRNLPTSQNGGGGGQSPGQGRSWQQNQQDGSAGNTADDSSSYDLRASTASRKTWQLRGLNITA